MDTFETLRNIALPSCTVAATGTHTDEKIPVKGTSLESTYALGKTNGEDNNAFYCRENSSQQLQVESHSDGTITLHDEESLRKFYEYSSSLLSLDTNKLNTFLINLDDKNITFLDDDRTREVVSATEGLIVAILNMVGEIDPRFQSTCIKSGSFYDGVKIGQADEFDFVAKIESLSKKNILEARESKRKKGFVYVVVTDKDTLETFREFITKPDNDECLRKDDNVLDVHEFQRYFCELVSSALKRINIPDNFIDSNNAKRNCYPTQIWCPFEHGPCATFRATYFCKSTSDVVDLDIDIAPSIVYPDENFRPPVVQILKNRIDDNMFIDRLQNISETENILLVPFKFDYIQYNKESWHYHYSDTWRVSFSSLEKALFGMYDICSTEKRLFRSLKVLKEIYLQNSTETEVKSGTTELKLEEPPSTFLTCCSVEAVGIYDSEEEEATYNCLANDTDSNGSSAREEDGKELTSFVGMAHVDKCSKISSGGSTRGLDNAEKVVDEAILAIESSGNLVRLPGAIDGDMSTTLKLQELKCKGQNVTGSISWQDRESSTDRLQMKTLSKQEGHLKDDSSFHVEVIYERQLGINANYPPDKQHCNQEETIYLRQRVMDAYKAIERPSVRETKSKDDDIIFDKMPKYRNSKPLIKTYIIKMLFFAMKAAYPDDKDWKEERLSTLVLLAMQMLYYAFSSEEKGFLNFWFQDFIENRTRNSTSIEILHTLQEVVNAFRNI